MPRKQTDQACCWLYESQVGSFKTSICTRLYIMFQAGPASPLLYSAQFKKTPPHKQSKKTRCLPLKSCNTKDRWWMETSGESQPLTASRNAMEFNTWKREGCTAADSLLRGSHPPQPRRHHGVCAVLSHLQVWGDAPQEVGECCYRCSIRSHNHWDDFIRSCRRCVLLI